MGPFITFKQWHWNETNYLTFWSNFWWEPPLDMSRGSTKVFFFSVPVTTRPEQIGCPLPDVLIRMSWCWCDEMFISGGMFGEVQWCKILPIGVNKLYINMWFHTILKVNLEERWEKGPYAWLFSSTVAYRALAKVYPSLYPQSDCSICQQLPAEMPHTHTPQFMYTQDPTSLKILHTHIHKQRRNKISSSGWSPFCFLSKSFISVHAS